MTAATVCVVKGNGPTLIDSLLPKIKSGLCVYPHKESYYILCIANSASVEETLLLAPLLKYCSYNSKDCMC